MKTLIDQPRIGMGCWAIGGHFHAGGTPLGWAGASDDQSRSALSAAYESGIRVFDTAVAYGAGHSERLLGEELSGKADAFFITKFAPLINEQTKEILGEDISPDAIRSSVEASRTRLNRDVIDMLLCHKNTMTVEEAGPVLDTLDDLVAEGKIAAYGWSTDFHSRLAAVTPRANFTAVEHTMNIFFDAPSTGKVAEASNLTQIIRSPLAMGVLTGKFNEGDRVAEGDIRSNTMDWLDYFKDGVVSADHLARLNAIRDLLTAGGRTLGQGALCWLLAKSDRTLPVPGAKTAAQASENAAALGFGPLEPDVMAEIEGLIDRPEEGPERER